MRKHWVILSVMCLMINGCTVNLQLVNEFAGQKGNGTIKEDAKTDEVTTPTVELSADIKQEGL